MIFIEPMPLESFVMRTLATADAVGITGNWRVDSKQIEECVCTALRNIGIYHVAQRQRKAVAQTIISLLRYSPEIIEMVKKTEREMLFRNQRRHAD
jgi:hypothetical protein